VAKEPTTRAAGGRQPEAPALLDPGALFAGHRIEREAGRGGMGIVYAATHVRLGITRALKVLSPDAARDPVLRARFERESRLAAALEHPSIVPVHEAGESDGLLYLSMRYIDGPDLSELLATHGALEPTAVGELVGQLAGALDTAHDHGLVHRDVKPANVLLESSGSGRGYLGDFGISRLQEMAHGLTGTGEMLGTVDYAAPEQIAGEGVDGRTDVYSLACVAFEALTGSSPFRRGTRLATMFAHANAPRPSASELRPELPAGVDRVLRRGLAVQPKERYATASEFAEDLDRALHGQARVKFLRLRRPRRPVLVGLGAIVAMAVAVAALAGVFDRGKTGRGASPATHRAEPVAAPTARVAGTVRVAPRPSAIAVGEINVWTASASKGMVSAIVPATNALAQPPIEVDGEPVSVTTGFGSVWVVDQRGDALVRLNPDEGTSPVRIPVGDRPSDVAVSTSRLWVSNGAEGTVSRVDPLSNQVDATVSVEGHPRALSVGEGGVWVAGSGGSVTEIDSDSAEVRGDPIRLSADPRAIAAGEAGVWVADPNRGVFRISPGSRDVSRAVLATRRPVAVAVGYGYAWVALDNGHVTRVDPVRLLPAGSPIAVGQEPAAIVAGKGFVWVANRADGTVSRIERVS
jgi:hypothetical protein